MRETPSQESVLEAIQRRVAEISREQHALALEKTRLQEHVTPLRLGVASPEAVLLQLKIGGIRLHGLGPTAPVPSPDLTRLDATLDGGSERVLPVRPVPSTPGRRSNVRTLRSTVWVDHATQNGAS
jgi:hypothetical protein